MSRLRRVGALARRLFAPALATAIVVLLISRARTIEWREVWSAFAQQDPTRLWLGGAAVIVAYAWYASYELVSRRHIGHGVAPTTCFSIGAVSYAFSLSLSALVGGLGLRYRLYSRFGLRPSTTARVIGFSILTNWVGYTALAGVLYASGAMSLPEDWPIGTAALRAIGVGMILAVLGYLALCGFARQRRLRLWRLEVDLVPLPIAGLQIALSVASWMSTSVVIWAVMDGLLPYTQVLGIALLAAIAGAAAHVPAGLGVIEAIFIALAGHQAPQAQLLAALLTYRMLFYFAPLVVAIPGAMALEVHARRNPQLNDGADRAEDDDSATASRS